MTTITISK